MQNLHPTLRSRTADLVIGWEQMGSLSPRLQVRVAQKQILTPGLVQMVSLLQLNRLELKDMISAEVAQNPVLEEAVEGGESLRRRNCSLCWKPNAWPTRRMDPFLK